MRRSFQVTISILVMFLICSHTSARSEAQKRAMTFLDIIEMRQCWGGDISPDGKWFIYSIITPVWSENKSGSDIYATPIGGKPRQVTFTKDRGEYSLNWYKDSSFFAFLSESPENKPQIFLMHPDSGETRQTTDDEYGVGSYGWSKDYKYLAYLGGDPGKRQIWIMPGKGGRAGKITAHKTFINSFIWSPDSKKIYFTAIDYVDSIDEERKVKGFDVIIKNAAKIPSHIWEIDIDSGEERRVTGGREYSIIEFIVSDDGTKLAFIGAPTGRYSTWFDNEIYMLDLSTNNISRITDNSTWEGNLSFSPDSRWLAFTIEENEIYMNLDKIYIAPTDGGKTKKLLGNFDYDGWISHWNAESSAIYFTAAVGVNYHLYRVSIENDEIEQITNFGNCVWFFKDEDSGKFIIAYSDPENPEDYYCSEPENFNARNNWIRLTDINPQVKDLSLGAYETIRWKSIDGTTVEGILVKPTTYQEGKRYPLIVQVHSGPAISYINYFEASSANYVHVFAANDYAVFQPNYRGSTGYGDRFMKGALGNYFRLGFEDIMTGVDHLIESGIAHPDSMGIMGWSAGGMFSNWALVSTDRFKAISSGAGVANWISLYAQTRFACEYYLQGNPYDNWEHYIDLSPLKHIKNARTPTLIHFGENDSVIPISQGDELYMALRKMGVPTEFIVYPNTGHNVSDMRYQMVKMQAEFNWFERWIRGKEGWIDWEDLIDTLEQD